MYVSLASKLYKVNNLLTEGTYDNQIASTNKNKRIRELCSLEYIEYRDKENEERTCRRYTLIFRTIYGEEKTY